MKNKYKVVALVPLEFSVEGNSDSKEAIESVKNIFEACRDDNDCADIVFDGIEESLRHDSIEYKVEAVQHEPEVKANSDIRSVASDICDIFKNYLDETVFASFAMMQMRSGNGKTMKAARCCTAWNIGISLRMSSSG